ncbi:carboxypeptidase-like regulatory domain-containing protein [Planctomicrobium sp. SH661]|uniref:carboxypeptidase-like regulatory domain-containing protein n=1 Tax=Planctomicrobium sp. SH661 TaxID=3448124 RepID=UPI003F5BE350
MTHTYVMKQCLRVCNDGLERATTKRFINCLSSGWLKKMKNTNACLCMVIVTGVAMTLGCGSNADIPELGRVSGTVTLDGQPLPEATVSFNPVENGRSSMATTDSQGHYELSYTLESKGALIGQYNVHVSTFQQGGDDPGDPPGVPEKVPQKYNKPGLLVKDVLAGTNVINIELTSK